MLKKLHKHYRSGHIRLLDYLAAQRTVLANDRTWLSFIRTSLTFFVAGVTFIQFFDSLVMTIVGWVFVPAGIAVLVYGFMKFHKFHKLMRQINKHNGIEKKL